ncbi:MAG: hypothetical protein JWL76_1188 [Thermoleophilia bacterium]|nr:hypothetical protein [Thermoleophilia bacterium]
MREGTLGGFSGIHANGLSRNDLHAPVDAQVTASLPSARRPRGRPGRSGELMRVDIEPLVYATQRIERALDTVQQVIAVDVPRRTVWNRRDHARAFETIDALVFSTSEDLRAARGLLATSGPWGSPMSDAIQTAQRAIDELDTGVSDLKLHAIRRETGDGAKLVAARAPLRAAMSDLMVAADRERSIHADVTRRLAAPSSSWATAVAGTAGRAIDRVGALVGHRDTPGRGAVALERDVDELVHRIGFLDAGSRLRLTEMSRMRGPNRPELPPGTIRSDFHVADARRWRDALTDHGRAELESKLGQGVQLADIEIAALGRALELDATTTRAGLEEQLRMQLHESASDPNGWEPRMRIAIMSAVNGPLRPSMPPGIASVFGDHAPIRAWLELQSPDGIAGLLARAERGAEVAPWEVDAYAAHLADAPGVTRESLTAEVRSILGDPDRPMSRTELLRLQAISVVRGDRAPQLPGGSFWTPSELSDEFHLRRVRSTDGQQQVRSRLERGDTLEPDELRQIAVGGAHIEEQVGLTEADVRVAPLMWQLSEVPTVSMRRGTNIKRTAMTDAIDAVQGMAVAARLAPIQDDTIRKLEDNIGRIGGVINDGCARHPKYEELGAAASNLRLLLSTQERPGTSARAAATASVAPASEAAVETATETAETLAW